MSNISVMGVFCEDIREEANGLVSLMGVFHDVVVIPSESGMLSKLCLYVRFAFPSNDPIAPGTVNLTFPDGQSAEVGSVDQSIIDKGISETKVLGGDWVTLVTKVVLGGVRISAGEIAATASLGPKKYRLGALKFKFDPSLAPA